MLFLARPTIVDSPLVLDATGVLDHEDLVATPTPDVFVRLSSTQKHIPYV
jgi:hypothetical protein